MNQHVGNMPVLQDGSRPQWSTLRPLRYDHPKLLAANRVVAVDRIHPAHMAFDMLRTKVLKSAREESWHTLGITAPTSGCGKATVAANLAISLAKQHDVKVVLLDLDLRRPRIARILGARGEGSIEEFLRGELLIEDVFVRMGDNLAIGAMTKSTPHPAELLQSAACAQALRRLQQCLSPDVVIYNMPPMLMSDDFSGLMPQLDKTLLVVGAEQSTIGEIDVCERSLTEQAKLLGVVLNKCRYASAQFDNYQR